MNLRLLRAGKLFRRTILMISLCCVGMLTVLPVGNVVQAQATTPVRYDVPTKTIYIGTNYDAANPAEAPFAGDPSRADAPKSPITISAVRTALDASLGVGEAVKLLENQGSGAWLLKTDLVVSPTARLELTSSSLKWLRLDSTPNRFPAYTRLIATGGHLLIQGIRVSSWDAQANDVDNAYLDGRSFMLAQQGARMDIIDAEVDHLGWADGEPSGLSWRKRATGTEPRTGATGSILRSNIHRNYFGQYSYEAFDLKVFNNEFHHNIYYGFDPHDFSIGFEVAYNKVYNNGKHGIIFSRGCEQNWIHHNEVYGNAEHGIMLDRGSNNNKISDNLVYNNRDGVALFQSSFNLIQNNVLRDNERGVRINATYDATDIFDGVSIQNTVFSNTIQNNLEYGIYLYERADKNTVAANTISGSGESGVNIKTGGNTVIDNAIRNNGQGVTIVGGDLTPIPPGGPTPIAAEGKPGVKNTISRNIIEDNSGAGVRVQRGSETLIGSRSLTSKPKDGNTIHTNGTYGVTLEVSTTESLVSGNSIHANLLSGVLVKSQGSIGNTISRNSIAINTDQGIRLSNGANNGIAAPTIGSPENATVITGTAGAGAAIEVYRDQGGQGQFYLGTTTASSQGLWSLPLPSGDDPRQGRTTAVATDSRGNSSQFGTSSQGSSTGVSVEVGVGSNGETTVYVSGIGASVTLPTIHAALQALTNTVLLEQQPGGVWQANAGLFINRGVTLTLNGPSVTWLRLRSQRSAIQLQAVEDSAYNYQSFAALRTYNGTIIMDGVRVTSWDPTANTYDTDVSDGRSYVLAKYDARLDVRNSDLSYLGSADGESYGVSWRDINSSEAPSITLTRVTGEVISSTFSYNYYGIYTYQAGFMTFRSNRFHNNIGYGFDPHDYSHHFVIEDNQAYENGNHGFIISRGCNNFVFRRNKSYNNRYTVGEEDRNAHGFMLDPGSPNSRYEQVPSFNNLLEQNEAWGNDGYGLRIVGSVSNTVRANLFQNNLQGITIEQGSTDNTISDNTITGSGIYGIFAYGGSDRTRITGNTISGSGRHGIYLKTGLNVVTGNVVTGNGSRGTPAVGAGIALLPESSLTATAADLGLTGRAATLATSDPDVLRALAMASELTGNRISNNTVNSNVDDGIEIKGASDTMVSENIVERNGSHGIYLSSGARKNMVAKNSIRFNGGHGIRGNGADTLGNSWSQNRVFENNSGGIVLSSGANEGLQSPKIIQMGRVVTGTTTPGAMIEVFSDDGYQGLYFEGSTTATADGSFKFSTTRAWRGHNINVTVTDAFGNSSGFSSNQALLIGNTRVYLPLIRRSSGK